MRIGLIRRPAKYSGSSVAPPYAHPRPRELAAAVRIVTVTYRARNVCGEEVT